VIRQSQTVSLSDEIEQCSPVSGQRRVAQGKAAQLWVRAGLGFGEANSGARRQTREFCATSVALFNGEFPVRHKNFSFVT
jgi:hypothetical protein